MDFPVQAEERLTRVQEKEHRSRSGYQWGFEREEDRALLGTCSIFDIHEASRRAEIGYALGCSSTGARATCRRR